MEVYLFQIKWYPLIITRPIFVMLIINFFMCFLVVFLSFRNGIDETLMKQLPQPFLCVSIYVKKKINLVNHQPDNS